MAGCGAGVYCTARCGAGVSGGEVMDSKIRRLSYGEVQPVRLAREMGRGGGFVMVRDILLDGSDGPVWPHVLYESVWDMLPEASRRVTKPECNALAAAAVTYLKAKRAAYDYGISMPAQTPAPERFAAARARDEARDHLVLVAEEYAMAAMRDPA